MLKTTCAVCGSTLEYESTDPIPVARDYVERAALARFLTAHEVCRTRPAAAELKAKES